MNENEQESTIEANLEVLPPSALEASERAVIDQQIATAKRFPRSIAQFKKRGIEMATLDDETAESCLYRRPVGKENGKQKFAEGMSVRMAEIVGACYGNLRVGSMLIEQTDRFVRAKGMAFDLETNFASSSEVVESTVDKQGRPYSERQRLLIAKVALAKARRDCTFQVVPRALARPIETAVRQVIAGDAKTFDKRREAVVSWVSKLGIEAERVWGAIGVKGPADITADHLELLTGLKTAIKEGDATIDECFPVEAPGTPFESLEDVLGAKASGQQKAQATADPPPKAEPTEAEKTKAKAGQEKLREVILKDLQGLVLDGVTTEKKLLALAKEKKLPGADTAAEAWELPAISLAEILALVKPPAGV